MDDIDAEADAVAARLRVAVPGHVAALRSMTPQARRVAAHAAASAMTAASGRVARGEAGPTDRGVVLALARALAVLALTSTGASWAGMHWCARTGCRGAGDHPRDPARARAAIRTWQQQRQEEAG